MRNMVRSCMWCHKVNISWSAWTMNLYAIEDYMIYRFLLFVCGLRKLGLLRVYGFEYSSNHDTSIKCWEVICAICNTKTKRSEWHRVWMELSHISEVNLNIFPVEGMCSSSNIGNITTEGSCSQCLVNAVL